MNKEPSTLDLYADLQHLAETAFPKRCATCNKIYHNTEEFIKETEQLRTGVSGIMESIDDDENPILELYRNCTCGSTLMNFYNDRRDLSEQGEKRRQTFEKVLKRLVDNGVERNHAREELLKVMRGEKSDLIKIRKPKA